MGWSSNPAESFKKWQGEWDGSMMCSCDQGCNQWLQKNQSKASLALKILQSNGSTSLDKLVQMENERVNKIWLRIKKWEVKRTRSTRQGL